MDKVDEITRHPLYRKSLQKIAEQEDGRIFCKHDMEHFLAVARIAMILNLQENLGISQEVIYGTALLHDIGRHCQYIDGIPHEQASYEIAGQILQDIEYTPDEKQMILDAISYHRSPAVSVQNDLCGIIYRADKKSRLCSQCAAREQCNWSPEKMNLTIEI